MQTLIRILGPALAAILLSACSAPVPKGDFPPLELRSTTPEPITLKTFGSPGQKFSVILMVDGLRREISGVTPAEYPLECIVLTGDVTREEGDGDFGFMIERQTRRGRFYTPSIQTHCSFRYHHGAIGVTFK